jgi:hypothetical protein
MKLFTVGPVACYPDVLEAMGRQMVSHRSEEYITMHYETVGQMQAMLETKNPVYLFSSSGTGFMEAAVKNCVSEKMIVCINGSFGKRFAQVGDGPRDPEIAEKIGAFRKRRTRFATTCLFCVLIISLMALQVYVMYPLWLNAVLLGTIIVFTWRTFNSYMAYGWW